MPLYCRVQKVDHGSPFFNFFRVAGPPQKQNIAVQNGLQASETAGKQNLTKSWLNVMVINDG